MGFASDTTNKYTDLLVSPCLTDSVVGIYIDEIATCICWLFSLVENAIFTGNIHAFVNIYLRLNALALPENCLT